MNPNNYATLEQSKRMKELGYPQTETDCVWATLGRKRNQFIIYTREELNWRDGVPALDDGDGDPSVFFTEWYAAPNASEIELNTENIHLIYDGTFCIKNDITVFGKIHHAQARCDAWIEKENKSGQ